MVLFTKVDLAQKVGQLQILKLTYMEMEFQCRRKKVSRHQRDKFVLFHVSSFSCQKFETGQCSKTFLASMIPFVYPQMLDKAENVQHSSLL